MNWRHSSALVLVSPSSRFNMMRLSLKRHPVLAILVGIHSFLGGGEGTQTAEFKLHFDLDYDVVTASAEALKNFTKSLIKDIAELLGCREEIHSNIIHQSSTLIATSSAVSPHLSWKRRKNWLNNWSRYWIVSTENELAAFFNPWSGNSMIITGKAYWRFWSCKNRILILDTTVIILMRRRKCEVADRITSLTDGIAMRWKSTTNIPAIKRGWARTTHRASGQSRIMVQMRPMSLKISQLMVFNINLSWEMSVNTKQKLDDRPFRVWTESI